MGWRRVATCAQGSAHVRRCVVDVDSMELELVEKAVWVFAAEVVGAEVVAVAERMTRDDLIAA